MKKHKALIIITICLAILLGSCKSTSNESQESVQSDALLVNQVGYLTNSDKKALIRMDAESFDIRTMEGETVYTGEAGDARYWDLSGDTVRIADFSKVTKAGEYVLCVDNTCSYPFSIADQLFNDLADAALKSYYYSRCGVAIGEEHGGKWNWSAGHPDTDVMVHLSAADEKRPVETIISSPGGWYDAGDYGKYIVNSSITTWTIVQSAVMNANFHKNQNLNIPESGNELPDVLDEALVNLKWMMTMQDPNDGGLYHKLTTKNFDGFIMPDQTSKQRYVVQKSTSAALDFAATMAAASRVVGSYEMEGLADEMKSKAIMAWKWAVEHPDAFYKQPKDVSTGAYPNKSFTDEWFWAASELFILTGESEFKEAMMTNYQKPITPKWDVVQALGVISLLTSEVGDSFPEIKNDFIAYANQMLEEEKESPYNISMGEFAWGSNSDVANDGMLKLVSYRLTGEQKYVASAMNDLDYILGRNATGYSFVTGFGDKTPQVPHNRIMSADGIDEPIPGYIVGGPNTIVLDDCASDGVVRSEFPAASYTDTECSYSTNETAINWNAPLVYLLSGIQDFENQQLKAGQ